VRKDCFVKGGGLLVFSVLMKRKGLLKARCVEIGRGHGTRGNDRAGLSRK